MACLICNHSAEKSLTEGGLTYFVACPVCGDYRIDAMTEAIAGHMPQDRKWLLAGLLRQAHERGEHLSLKGNAPYQLTDKLSFPDPPERALRLLRYLDAHSGPQREPFELDDVTDYAAAFAAGPQDFLFLRQSVIERKLIERAGRSDRPLYRLTMLGYDELRRAQSPVTPQPEPPSAPAPLPANPVTGLPDRSVFNTDSPAAVTDAQTNGYPLALLMIDGDRFKKVNDTHGHQKGDEVLRGLAASLRTAVTGKGTPYHWGGDEMAALLPNHSLDEALAVAERFRRSVSAAATPELPVTVSVGVAVFPDHATDDASLLGVADKAMYDAKKRGGDLVRYHGEPEPKPEEPTKPHTPQRSQPAASALPDGWAEAARLAFHQGKRVQCPHDKAILRAEPNREMGQIGGVYFACEFCGLDVEAPGKRV
jgi:diguanylate cyclase (GGDEF)-like protein